MDLGSAFAVEDETPPPPPEIAQSLDNTWLVRRGIAQTIENRGDIRAWEEEGPYVWFLKMGYSPLPPECPIALE